MLDTVHETDAGWLLSKRVRTKNLQGIDFSEKTRKIRYPHLSDMYHVEGVLLARQTSTMVSQNLTQTDLGLSDFYN